MLYGVNPIYINTYNNVKYVGDANQGVRKIQRVDSINKSKNENETKAKSFGSKSDKSFDAILKSKLDKKV